MPTFAPGCSSWRPCPVSSAWCAARYWREGTGVMDQHSTLHEGERAVQQRLGVHERMAEVMGLVVRPAMPEQHRELFGKLPLLYVGSVDHQRRPIASVLAG